MTQTATTGTVHVRGSRGGVRRLGASLVGASLALTSMLAPAAAATPAEAGPVTATAQAAVPGPTASSLTLASLDAEGADAFVRAVYADFLGRAPSSGDRAYWGLRVQGGQVSRYDLGVQVSRSDEWITTVITGFYRDTLGRAPDATGLRTWIDAARSGMPVAQVAAKFYASTEYFQTVGRSDNGTWVRDLYRKLLLREGEAAGVSSWVRALQGGMRRDALAFAFYQAQETVSVRIDALYRDLLGRTAEPGGLLTWSPFVRANGDLVLAAALAGSTEYYQRARTRFPGDGTPPSWVEVVGTGTPSSCTSAALLAAIRDGGSVAFDCGPNPLTITVAATLYTCNSTTCATGGTPVDTMVLDGGGLVTLSGGGVRGIYYANACEPDFGWLTSRCDLDTRPHVTFRDITFVDGNAQGAPTDRDGVGGGEGGGAIAMRAGRLTLDQVTFRDNTCITAHSDGGGGAVRVVGMQQAVEITASTFAGNRCANGGGLSSLHAPMEITGSVFTGNTATGHGASPGLGGNGGAIYFDGTHQNVRVVGSTITGNYAPEGGPGIFYVSNSRTGTLTIEGTTITGNSGERFSTPPYRDIYYLGTSSVPVVRSSTIE